jgi:hypothetical protein
MANIANFYDADRRSAKAGETLVNWQLVKVSDYGDGQRKLMSLLDADAAQVTAGKFAVVAKFTAEPNLVQSSTVPARLGSRMVAIAAGDDVVEVKKGAIIEYAMSELDASLDTARAGTAPAVEDVLHAKSGLFCKVGTVGALAQTVGTVYKVFGTKVLIKVA